MADLIKVISPNVKYTENYIESQYDYHTSVVSGDNGTYTVTNSVTKVFIMYAHTTYMYICIVLLGILPYS